MQATRFTGQAKTGVEAECYQLLARQADKPRTASMNYCYLPRKKTKLLSPQKINSQLTKSQNG